MIYPVLTYAIMLNLPQMNGWLPYCDGVYIVFEFDMYVLYQNG